MPTTQQETLTAPNDPQLQLFLEQVQAVRIDARSLMEGLSRAQFNWRPDGKRWSVGQCLEHLVLTFRLYPREIERMIIQSRARQQREKPYRDGVFNRWFIRSMEPPPAVRVRTARNVEPPRDLDPDVVAAEFEAMLDDIARFIRQADGVSLVHSRMRSPFMPLLQFTLGQTIALNLAHMRRHLWQARQVTSAAGFPPG